MSESLVILALTAAGAAAVTVALAILPRSRYGLPGNLNDPRARGGIAWRVVSPAELLKAARGWLPAAMAGLILGLFSWALLGLPLPALVVGALAAAMEQSLGRWRQARTRARQREGLVAAIDLLAQLLPAGHGVRQAIQVLAESGPMELRSDLSRIVVGMRETSLELALAEADARLQQPLFSLIATTLTVGGRSGGQITPLLDELSRAAHQIQAAQDQLRAEQAQGRLGALVIALMPLALIGVLRVVNPAYLSPYDSWVGQLVLTGLMALIVVGYLWMLRILRITDLDLLVPRRGPGAGSATTSVALRNASEGLRPGG